MKTPPDAAPNKLPAIGGVFALADLAGPRAEVGHSIWDAWVDGGKAHSFRNARSALRHVLTSLRPPRLWLPAYACAEIAQAALGLSVELAYFPIDSRLEPEVSFLRKALSPGDAVLAINYFGRPIGPDPRRLVSDRPDVVWIEDCAQSLDTGVPPFSGLRLFSPRKLLGVPDGGILVDKEGRLPPPDLKAGSVARFAYPSLLRKHDIDDSNNTVWYAAFHRAETAMTVSTDAMSRVTREVLDRASLAKLAARRVRNFAALAEDLSPYAVFDDRSPNWAPLGFPILVSDPGALVATLAKDCIFAPRHWRALAMPTPPREACSLSRHMVTLPCDHRYDDKDMSRLVRAVRDILQ